MLRKTVCSRKCRRLQVAATFSIDCQRCERLRDFLHQVKQENPAYYCKPVPSFGDAQAQFLIVGLAPGKHGANATGRPFTGDHAGLLLYATLHRFGFASSAQSLSATDGLCLHNCRITNAVRCLPPDNKPTPAEVANCNAYLTAEIAELNSGVILALGAIAHKAVIKALGLRQAEYPFAHAATFALPNHRILIDSYHCSRYNTQTGRLTAEMFNAVFQLVQEQLNALKRSEA